MAERRMVLFEDEGDDVKITELHKFMEGTDLEWEGDNCGITIWLNPRPGDTIIITDDGFIKVERKSKSP